MGLGVEFGDGCGVAVGVGDRVDVGGIDLTVGVEVGDAAGESALLAAARTTVIKISSGVRRFI